MAAVSGGVRIELWQAEAMARDVVELLTPACERIAVAGSIRRRKAEVGDIEVVVTPKMVDEPEGLWGEPVQVDLLSVRLAELRAKGELVPRVVTVHRQDGSEEESQRVGERYQALEYVGFPVDLFIVRPPADWGVLFTIRTGPADWSERLVTDCQRRFLRVSGGQLTHFGKPVPCPEEQDFLAAIGQPWVEPPERSAGRVALS
jgi:DNA polymerase/3'-5' exonuclease PolX